jgi:hypothetical protein
MDARYAIIHGRSEATGASLTSLPVNDSVVTRCFCCGPFDFKEREAVGLHTAHPQGRAMKAEFIHVEQRVHWILPEGPALRLGCST